MMRKLALILPALLLAAPATVPAQNATSAAAEMPRAGAYKLEKSHAKLNWDVSHFGFSTYSGEFTDFDMAATLDPARPERSSLTATVNMNSVNTNNPALDKHLATADFFETAKYGKAEFRSTRVERTGPATARVTGDLTMRGVTKPLTLDVRFNKAGQNPLNKAYTVGFDATGVVKRSLWGVNYAVPAVGDDVKLSFSGEFNPAQADPRPGVRR